jgi:hypothetical protein
MFGSIFCCRSLEDTIAHHRILWLQPENACIALLASELAYARSEDQTGTISYSPYRILYLKPENPRIALLASELAYARSEDRTYSP